MIDNIIFWGGVTLFVVLVLFIAVAPLRQVILKLLGFESPWKLIIGILSPILHAHLTVLNNFRPRRIIYPSLESSKKTTTVKD